MSVQEEKLKEIILGIKELQKRTKKIERSIGPLHGILKRIESSIELIKKPRS